MRQTRCTKYCPGNEMKGRVWSLSTQNSVEWQQDVMERKMIRDIFNFKMRNRDAQSELCRETKTLEEALKKLMSYERGDKYAKTYKRSVPGSTGSAYTAPRGFSVNQGGTSFVDGDEESRGDVEQTRMGGPNARSERL